MKKILKSLFSLLVVLGLVSVVAACNKKTEEHKTPTPVETEKTPAPTPTPTPDKEKGCGGSVIASLFGVVALAGAVLVVSKRRKEQ